MWSSFLTVLEGPSRLLSLFSISLYIFLKCCGGAMCGFGSGWHHPSRKPAISPRREGRGRYLWQKKAYRKRMCVYELVGIKKREGDLNGVCNCRLTSWTVSEPWIHSAVSKFSLEPSRCLRPSLISFLFILSQSFLSDEVLSIFWNSLIFFPSYFIILICSHRLHVPSHPGCIWLCSSAALFHIRHQHSIESRRVAYDEGARRVWGSARGSCSASPRECVCVMRKIFFYLFSLYISSNYIFLRWIG